MRIAILDDYARAALRLADWDRLGAEVTVFADTVADEDALAARLEPFEVLCVMRERTPLTAGLIARLPNLKLIVTSGPRNAAIDLDAAKARGIAVAGTGSRKTTTSELAFLLILAANRGLMTEVRSLESGGWQRGLGRDLTGLTLGLIGLGNIGGQMAALGRAFGMEVVAWSSNLTEARAAEAGARRMDSLPDLMAASDVASVHLVLSERSTGLVGAEAFAAARPGLVFVNTSRGPIVDTAALLDGLRAGHPSIAALDVFDHEPLPADEPLMDRDLIESGRLLLTPHLGYTTEATFRVFYNQQVQAVLDWKQGRQPETTLHWP